MQMTLHFFGGNAARFPGLWKGAVWSKRVVYHYTGSSAVLARRLSEPSCRSASDGYRLYGIEYQVALI